MEHKEKILLGDKNKNFILAQNFDYPSNQHSYFRRSFWIAPNGVFYSKTLIH